MIDELYVWMNTFSLVRVGTSLVVAACLFSCSSRGGLCCRALPVRGGYGYAVLYEGDTLIKQPYIPAVSGRVVFRTEQEALKVGQLVCDKLRAGLPPTVTRREVENCLKETGP